MSKKDLKKEKKLPKQDFSKQDGTRGFYYPYKKSTSQNYQGQTGIMTGFSSKDSDEIIDDISDDEDKGIPLMKPTFFDENDPANPKYVSIEDKKKLLEIKEKELKKKDKELTALSLLLVIVEYLIGGLGATSLIKFLNIQSTIGLFLTAVSIAIPTVLVGIVTTMHFSSKTKSLEKEIDNLVREINTEEKEKELAEQKEKCKGLSKESKKILKDLRNNEEIQEQRKAFGMTYDDFLDFCEKVDGFEEDDIDKAVEDLLNNGPDESFENLLEGLGYTDDSQVLEENLSNDQPKTIRKRYKVIGRKSNKKQQ